MLSNDLHTDNEIKLRILIDSMSEGMVYLDRTGTIQDANKAAEEILGVSRHDIVGQRYPQTKWKFLDSNQKPITEHLLPGFRSLKEGAPIKDIEMLVMQPTGKVRRIRVTGAPVFNSSNTPEGSMVTFVDITMSHNIQQVLAKNEATMRAILENVPFGVILVDTEFRVITMANRYARQLLGVDEVELTGRTCHEFICIAQQGKCPIIDLGRTMDNAERNIVNKAGEHIPVLKTVIPIELQDQRYILECFIDIRDRKALEAQLGQAQKLEAVGRLAAGIAHEINTPAQYVGDNTAFLKDAFKQICGVCSVYDTFKTAVKNNEIPEGLIDQIEAVEEAADMEFLLEDIPSAISQSLDGIKRITEIVRAMKEFAHPAAEHMTVTNLNQALMTTATVSRNEWKYVAKIETDLDPQLPAVPCYPGEINQVFLNLIVNAAHAIADAKKTRGDFQGVISLKTKQEDDFIRVFIKDNGAGIPTDIQPKIMDPFFTTKEVGRGTGQGLPIARTCIVEKHKGNLTFETEEGVGTTFIVTLPLATKDDTQPAP